MRNNSQQYLFIRILNQSLDKNAREKHSRIFEIVIYEDIIQIAIPTVGYLCISVGKCNIA